MGITPDGGSRTGGAALTQVDFNPKQIFKSVNETKIASHGA